jgi:hypothetical protein
MTSRFARLARLSTLLVGVAILTSCTHTFLLPAHSSPPLSLPRARDKRVAVVLLPRNVHTSYESSTDGHTFILNDVPSFYQAALRSALKGSVEDVQFFLSVPTVPFDAYVYPEARIETAGYFPHRCTVQFAVTVLDGWGRVMAREKAEAVGTFVPVAAAGDACLQAMRESFDAVSAKGVRTLDGV